MPRRKKGRLTLKKKPPQKNTEICTPDGLSARQFAALADDHQSFLIEDAEHEEHMFCLNDTAYIQHHDSGDSGDSLKDEHWIGVIKEIRGNGTSDVWIRVEWLWSPQEVAEVIKSFNPNICGKYEKLRSNNCDFISVHCVVDHVEVKTFEQTNIFQEPIGDDEWFTRFDFNYDACRISPKVTHDACSICKIPYIPGEDKIHHFCPRPRCSTFYHQSCLVKRGYVEETRAHRVIETWPEIDRSCTVKQLAEMFHPRKKQKTQLVAVAEQQILRGVRGGGIVGNIASVTAARRFIYHALLDGTGDIPEDWKARVDTTAVSSDPDTLPNCICPSCYGAI